MNSALITGEAEEAVRTVRLVLRGHRWRFSCDEQGLGEMLDRVGELGSDPAAHLERFGAALVRRQLVLGDANLPEGLHPGPQLFAPLTPGAGARAETDSVDAAVGGASGAAEGPMGGPVDARGSASGEQAGTGDAAGRGPAEFR